jgi:hypothetical protein
MTDCRFPDYIVGTIPAAVINKNNLKRTIQGAACFESAVNKLPQITRFVIYRDNNGNCGGGCYLCHVLKRYIGIRNVSSVVGIMKLETGN